MGLTRVRRLIGETRPLGVRRRWSGLERDVLRRIDRVVKVRRVWVGVVERKGRQRVLGPVTKEMSFLNGVFVS